MSFVKGTIIFGDNNNHLYNFLTCGIKNGICDKFIFKKISTHWTIDNKNVFDKSGVISNDTFFTANSALILHPQACRNNKCLKLVLSFDNPIKYLCNNIVIEKKVLLFYRFKHGDNKYIFFKLKNNKYDDIELNNTKDIINDQQFFNRNENNDINNNYKLNIINENNATIQYDKINFYDKIDYTHMIELEIKNIELELENKKIDLQNNIDYYNKHLRTGYEIFIDNNLKKYFFQLNW